MHVTAYEELGKFAATLQAVSPLKIADVGAYNVNGCLRPIFDKAPWTYVGIDMAAGPNVDLVVPAEGRWDNVQDCSFDVAVSVSTLEHTKYPWLVVQEMARILKPGGIICLCAPYVWPQHRHPLDCWRIFPDGMRAIMELARLRVDKLYMREAQKNPECGDTVAIGGKP